METDQTVLKCLSENLAGKRQDVRHASQRMKKKYWGEKYRQGKQLPRKEKGQFFPRYFEEPYFVTEL